MQPIKKTKVYDMNALAYAEGFRYIINQGSARSSKTFSLLQLMYDIAQKPKPRLISIVSQTLPHLRRGAIRDFLNYLITTGQYVDENWSKGNLIYTVNNSQIEFFSVDQADKVYGPARDILLCNEIPAIPEEIFKQLAIRTKEKIFVDYNPVCDFYITEDYKHRKNAKYIHSTYKDNPYLEEEIIKELLEAGKRNQNFQKVFVEGEVGEIIGAVFTNWDVKEFDNTCPLIAYGQDYGFSNDPSTLIKVGINRAKKEIYLKELLYRTGLSTQQLYVINKENAGRSLIIADSAEPRLIEELRKLGNNIRAAEKGQGSLTAGISLLQDYMIYIDPTSLNAIKEFKNYVYLDKGSKLVIDDFNHIIDPLRYVATFLLKHGNKGATFKVPKYH